jgi:hypothetical protein
MSRRATTRTTTSHVYYVETLLSGRPDQGEILFVMVVQDYEQTVANYDGTACSITLNVLITLNLRETKLVTLNEKKSIEGLSFV